METIVLTDFLEEGGIYNKLFYMYFLAALISLRIFHWVTIQFVIELRYEFGVHLHGNKRFHMGVDVKSSLNFVFLC